MRTEEELDFTILSQQKCLVTYFFTFILKYPTKLLLFIEENNWKIYWRSLEEYVAFNLHVYSLIRKAQQGGFCSKQE